MKHPNPTGISTYSYSGKMVTATAPAGKWKTFTMDALGNLTQVTEPRPGGGNYTTSYYYNPMGKLIRVEMPRDGVTQVRTFVYDAATQRLMSATNPETGTVTYAYNADGTLKSKTDARGNRTENTYDDKQRVTMAPAFNGQFRAMPCGCETREHENGSLPSLEHGVWADGAIRVQTADSRNGNRCQSPNCAMTSMTCRYVQESI